MASSTSTDDRKVHGVRTTVAEVSPTAPTAASPATVGSTSGSASSSSSSAPKVFDDLHVACADFSNRAWREKQERNADFYRTRGAPRPVRKEDMGGQCQSDSGCTAPQQFYSCAICRHRRCCDRHMFQCLYCGDSLCDVCVPAYVPGESLVLCAACVPEVTARGPIRAAAAWEFLRKVKLAKAASLSAGAVAAPAKKGM